MVIGVTGHRPEKLGGDYYEVNSLTNIEIVQMMMRFILNKVCHDPILGVFKTSEKVKLITGMALGADLLFAETALLLKNMYPDRFILECAVPCYNHTSRWQDKKVIKRYNEILEEADSVKIVSERNYDDYVMQIRNEYIVDNSDVLLAIWNGSKGGTRNCVEYAMKTDIEIQRYHPTTKSLKRIK